MIAEEMTMQALRKQVSELTLRLTELGDEFGDALRELLGLAVGVLCVDDQHVLGGRAADERREQREHRKSRETAPPVPSSRDLLQETRPLCTTRGVTSAALAPGFRL